MDFLQQFEPHVLMTVHVVDLEKNTSQKWNDVSGITK